MMGLMTLDQPWYARDARGWTCGRRTMTPRRSIAPARVRGDAAGRGAGPGGRTRPRAAVRQGRVGPVRPARVQVPRRVVGRLPRGGGADRVRRAGRARRAAGASAPAPARRRPRRPAALVTATDGNHGRAVARTARLLGLPARVYLPKVAPDIVIDRISAEGARRHRGRRGLRRHCRWRPGATPQTRRRRRLLIQDTAWDGYEVVPSWIVAATRRCSPKLTRSSRRRACSAGDLV